MPSTDIKRKSVFFFFFSFCGTGLLTQIVSPSGCWDEGKTVTLGQQPVFAMGIFLDSKAKGSTCECREVRAEYQDASQG